MNLRTPPPLHPGSLIAVSAPSSGVPAPLHARLDLVLGHLRARGFEVVEGATLRRQHKNASAPARERAEELMRFLLDDRVDAVFPPWGGELAIELLPLMDFARLAKVRPKWLLGFSDVSTIQLPLTLLSGWVTAHGPNLMDLAPSQTDPLTGSALAILSSPPATELVQRSSARYQTRWPDWATTPEAPLSCTEPTRWRRLDGLETPVELRGRVLGGCLDCLSMLAGTRFVDVPRFARDSGPEGTLLYLENCELAPCALARALFSLRFHGWLDGLSGLLLGRSAGPEGKSAADLSYADALQEALGDLPFPVLVDVDIGHRPPQLTLLNGLPAVVRFGEGGGSVAQVIPGET